MNRGMNSTEMQKANRSLVLKTLLENKSMTRSELASKVGLQKATITNIISEFCEIGIVENEGDSAAGRRGEQLCLRLEKIYIISIRINRKNYRIKVYSLQGKTLDRIQVKISAENSIYEIVASLKTSLAELLEKFDKKKIIGVSLGLPGPYIRKSGDISNDLMLVSDFEQLSFVNMHKELEEVLRIPVFSEHDAKLAAYAEWRNARERQAEENASLIALESIGFGIGCGIVIKGEIVQGKLGIAGEIGHMGINYNGKKQMNGSWDSTYEYCAGTESAVRYMKERLYEFPYSNLTEQSTYKEIEKEYEKKDPLAVYAVEKMAWMLGYGIANLIYIINPDCIILGKDYPNSPEFLRKVQESVERFVHPSILSSVSIRCSVMEEDTTLLGGYYQVVEKLFKENKILECIKRTVE